MSFLLTSNLNVYQQKTRIVIHEVTLVEAPLSCMVGIRKGGKGILMLEYLYVRGRSSSSFLHSQNPFPLPFLTPTTVAKAHNSLHNWLPRGAEGNHAMA